MSFSVLTARLSNLRRTIRFAASATGGWSVLWLAVIVLLGLLPAVTILLTKALVDALVTGLRGGAASWSSVRPVLIYGGIMAGLVLAGRQRDRGGVGVEGKGLGHEHGQLTGPEAGAAGRQVKHEPICPGQAARVDEWKNLIVTMQERR